MYKIRQSVATQDFLMRIKAAGSICLDDLRNNVLNCNTLGHLCRGSMSCFGGLWSRGHKRHHVPASNPERPAEPLNGWSFQSVRNDLIIRAWWDWSRTGSRASGEAWMAGGCFTFNTSLTVDVLVNSRQTLLCVSQLSALVWRIRVQHNRSALGIRFCILSLCVPCICLRMCLRVVVCAFVVHYPSGLRTRAQNPWRILPQKTSWSVHARKCPTFVHEHFPWSFQRNVKYIWPPDQNLVRNILEKIFTTHPCISSLVKFR